MRNNQLNYKKQPYIFRKKRKRIETLFSQLCNQFKIRKNYAKSFEGFKNCHKPNTNTLAASLKLPKHVCKNQLAINYSIFRFYCPFSYLCHLL